MAEFPINISILSNSNRSEISSKAYSLHNIDWKPISREYVSSPSAIFDEVYDPLISLRIDPVAGFHSSIFIDIDNSSVSNMRCDNVDLIFHLPLSEHAFADPFHIRGIRSGNENITFSTYGNPDLEAPTFKNNFALSNGVIVRIKSVMSALYLKRCVLLNKFFS